MLSEQEIHEMIIALVGAEEVYGLNCSPSQDLIQARVLVDCLPYLQTFRLDPDTGKYYLESEQPLGQLKL